MEQEKKKDIIQVKKESLYDRIPLTTKQLDVILVLLAIAFVALMVFGALKGNGII